ncbi:MAG: hypothetical protein V1857_05750 [archaeon]
MSHDSTSNEADPTRNVWFLKTDRMIPNLTWYWWWWLFFVKDPDRPNRTKQLMILWSTKNTNDITIMDKKWSMRQLPAWDGNVLKFNGVTAAWWYDNEKMHHPLLLEEMDFEVHNNGDNGELRPIKDGTDYRFYGNPEKYVVNVKDSNNDFHFEATPWNDCTSKHRFREKDYTRKYGHNILQIYGMKMRGQIDGIDVEGSACHQRVAVNAPGAPWYWALVHWDVGDHFVLSSPFVGPQIFRNTENATSLLDWGDIRLYRSLRYYHKETDTEYEFKTSTIRIKHVIENGLPTFDMTGTDEEKEIHLRAKAYARAFWRFQQPSRWGLKSILYYNEYPAEVVDFSFSTKDGAVNVKKEDLGESAGHLEHTWGKLI